MKTDMTEGSIQGHLARFAVPLILGNMFQLNLRFQILGKLTSV